MRSLREAADVLQARAELVNRLANLPAVLPFVAPGYAAVDMLGIFRDPRNVALGDETGMALFSEFAPGAWEGHYLFPPGTRSSELLRRCRGFLSEMFTDYDAHVIVGRVPADHRRARTITIALGFTPQGLSVTPSGRSCVEYVLERATWANSSAASSAA